MGAARLLWGGFAATMNLPERPMRWAQSRLRDGRLGWLFVAPNLAVFSLFTFLPIAIDVYYALTGGTDLLPSQRPFVGAQNLAQLLACKN
ncbi:MAG TPA: sugar ABC transporter permease, partial [Acetobacteraceae bacterium]|nr:sugar ABC transporter permease [Acetobacteraceae bacterium]